MFRVIYEKHILKDLDKIPNHDVEKILRAIKELALKPLLPGSKRLSGREGFFRIRQGDYRIVYLIDYKEKLIKIILIAHRKEAYRRF